MLCRGTPDKSLFVNPTPGEDRGPLRPYGAVVHSIDAGSPLGGSVKKGDVLLSIDGQDLGGRSLEDIKTVLLSKASALKQAQLLGQSAPSRVVIEFASLAASHAP
jgi:S1-C subfamily serine protease